MAVPACGGGTDTPGPDGGGGNGDAAPSDEDPAVRWGAAGTGCPVHPTSLTPVAVIGASHTITWDADVSIRVAPGDGVARAYSASAITLTSLNESVTSTSATAVPDPLYLELSNPSHDLRIEGRKIGLNLTGPRRLCIDGVRGNISAPVALDARQAVVYTDIFPGSSTSVSSPDEVWIYIKGSGQVTLDASSRDADVDIDASLEFAGTCSGGVCDGTLGTGGDLGSSIYVGADGPVHLLRDLR